MRLTKNNNSSVLSACAFSILIHLVVIPALKAALNAKFVSWRACSWYEFFSFMKKVYMPKKTYHNTGRMEKTRGQRITQQGQDEIVV